MPSGLGKRLLFIALAVGLAYFVYLRFFVSFVPGGMMGGALPVGVAEVIVRPVRSWQEFSGRLAAVESAEIRPQVPGLIDRIHFEEGQQVEKGDLLFTIDQRPYRAALEAAEARLTLASAELERAKALLAERAISQREYDQRQNAAAVARADRTRAKLDYDYTLITAPVSGRVSRAEITVGNLVSVGMPLLTTVVADRPIYADFDIDENSYLRYAREAGGDMEKLRSIPVFLGLSGEEGAPHAGSVQSFDNQLNARTGTLRVRAIFANEDGALMPGLFARVRLGGVAEREEVLISDRAIGTDQTQKFVFVVGAENKPEKRVVTLGGEAEGLRIATGGLKPGDAIIVTDMQKLLLMPGMPVEPKPAAMQGSEVGGQGSGEGKTLDEKPSAQPTGENEP